MSRSMTHPTNSVPHAVLRQLSLVLVACSALHLPGFDSALAHHSNAMFDKSVLREVTATIKGFQWTNPHVWIQVYIENETDEQEEWSIEGGGPNTLFRNGWRPDSFKPGDVVELKFHPMHDGSHAALFVGARFADRTTLGAW